MNQDSLLSMMSKQGSSTFGFGQCIETDDPHAFDPVYYDGELPIYWKNGTLDLDKCEEYIDSDSSIIALGKGVRYHLIEALQSGYYKKPQINTRFEKNLLKKINLDVHDEIYPFVIEAYERLHRCS